MLLTEDEDDTVFVSAPTKQAKKARKHSLKEAKEDNRPSAKKHQYCQVRNINILNIANCCNYPSFHFTCLFSRQICFVAHGHFSMDN